MNLTPQRRKPNRLQGYDYSQNGVYFVTMCSKNRENLLSGITVGEGSTLLGIKYTIRENVIHLTEYGIIVDYYIQRIHLQYATVSVDHAVIMPNHIHMILCINGSSDPFGTVNPSPTIASVLGWFKFQTTKQICMETGWQGIVWQRSYHDHIIRNEEEYRKISQYIDENPLKWQLDCYYNI